MKGYDETNIPFQLIDLVTNMLDKRNRNNYEMREHYVDRLKQVKRFVDDSLREYNRKYNNRR